MDGIGIAWDLWGSSFLGSFEGFHESKESHTHTLGTSNLGFQLVRLNCHVGKEGEGTERCMGPITCIVEHSFPRSAVHERVAADGGKGKV